jgi:beta-phosphoglucomutase-like phosphatase (HAD superfamily)
VNEFGLIIASASGAPGASVGASTTPGNNSYGSYASIMSGATVTDDVYGLWIIVNTGFVSGSAREEIQYALKKLGIHQHFQFILGAEDYVRSKPEPDGYIEAMGALGLEPSKVLVFEDSQAGIRSARSAGTWVAAVTSTNYTGQDQSEAHLKIKDFVGINADWVKSLKVS